jgi:hypothetical protein
MKKKLDLNQLAKSIVEQATGEAVPEKDDGKNKTAHENERLSVDLPNPASAFSAMKLGVSCMPNSAMYPKN